MDAFITSLTATINDTVLVALRDRVNAFADAMVELVAKSGGTLTRDQVVALWAEVNPQLVKDDSKEKKSAAPKKDSAPVTAFDSDSLTKLTVQRLKELAKEKSVTLTSKMVKKDIVEALVDKLGGMSL